MNIFKTLTFTAAGDEKKWSKVIEKLDCHFIPQRNIIYERSVSHERKQLQNESVEEYARKLHELAATCEFVDKDDQIRDRFVIGLLDSDIKRRLQLESELKLEKAVQDARQYEMIKSQMTGLTLATGEEKNVQEINRRQMPNFKAQFKKHDGA